MSKAIKIKRNTKIYKRRKRVPSWLLFALIVLLAVVLGFFGAKALSNYRERAKEGKEDVSSQVTESSNLEESSEESSVPEPEPAVESMKAQVMPWSVLQDEGQYAAFFAEVKANGNQVVLLELKDEAGYLYYTSQNETALSAGAVVANAVDLPSVCKAITDAGLTPAARISTLRDYVAASTDRENTYLYNNQAGLSWLDDSLENGGKRWLNPYQKNARDYITDLAVEIAKAGCEKIILKEMQYPAVNQYGMGVVNEYDTRIHVLKQLYEEVKAGVSAQGAELWTEFYADTYLGLHEQYYGGSPAEIGSDRVVLYLSVSTLQAGSKLDLFADIDVYQNPAGMVDAVLKEITDGQTEFAVEMDSQTSIDLTDVLAKNEISSVIQ